jgi:hypothetical protein
MLMTDEVIEEDVTEDVATEIRVAEETVTEAATEEMGDLDISEMEEVVTAETESLAIVKVAAEMAETENSRKESPVKTIAIWCDFSLI